MNGEEKEGDPIEDTGDPLFGADEGADTETGGGHAADDTPDDEPTRKGPIAVIVRPDRIGRRSMRELEVRLSWGHYVTVPPLPEEVFLDEAQQFDPAWRKLKWQRMPGAATAPLQDRRDSGVGLGRRNIAGPLRPETPAITPVTPVTPRKRQEGETENEASKGVTAGV